MENRILIKNELYDIPAVFSYPDTGGRFPAIILCHGTASCKDEAGNLFVRLAKSLIEKGIASIRFDFAGCGESRASLRGLTFFGEVSDTERVYSNLCQCNNIDSNRIGILGLSQGARVMAEFLGRYPKNIKVAVSWSGACHDKEGVFSGWFREYYEEAVKNGYAKIPLLWRNDFILPKKWFDDIRGSYPMKNLSLYEGAILAVSGTEDFVVPYSHAREIINACKGKIREAKIVKGADHIFNVLQKDKPFADEVIQYTANWIATHI